MSKLLYEEIGRLRELMGLILEAPTADRYEIIRKIFRGFTGAERQLEEAELQNIERALSSSERTSDDIERMLRGEISAEKYLQKLENWQKVIDVIYLKLPSECNAIFSSLIEKRLGKDVLDAMTESFELGGVKNVEEFMDEMFGVGENTRVRYMIKKWNPTKSSVKPKPLTSNVQNNQLVSSPEPSRVASIINREVENIRQGGTFNRENVVKDIKSWIKTEIDTKLFPNVTDEIMDKVANGVADKVESAVKKFGTIEDTLESTWMGMGDDARRKFLNDAYNRIKDYIQTPPPVKLKDPRKAWVFYKKYYLWGILIGGALESIIWTARIADGDLKGKKPGDIGFEVAKSVLTAVAPLPGVTQLVRLLYGGYDFAPAGGGGNVTEEDIKVEAYMKSEGYNTPPNTATKVRQQDGTYIITVTNNDTKFSDSMKVKVENGVVVPK